MAGLRRCRLGHGAVYRGERRFRFGVVIKASRSPDGRHPDMFTILWDNDGVLVDTEGLYFQATKTVLKTLGIDLTPGQFKEISLRRGQSSLTLAATRGVSDQGIAQLRKERDRIYAETLGAQSRLIDGVEDVLRSLHGKVRMGVVTSTSREHFEIAHAKSVVGRCMDFVITREDCQDLKPHPEPYLTAVRRYGLRAEECDRRRGLRTGTGIGQSSGAGVPDCPERVDEGRRLPSSLEGAGQHPVRAGSGSRASFQEKQRTICDERPSQLRRRDSAGGSRPRCRSSALRSGLTAVTPASGLQPR